MADILGAVALNQAQFQQSLAIALTKQNLNAQAQIVDLVADTVGTDSSQPLNSSGTGQVLNLLT